MIGRRFFVPETIQTSGMDCGPAALKSLLAGLSIEANYERLRDACQTDADGTSIDALEDLCSSLGLEAFQEMAPIADAVTVLARRAPCIVVVRTGGGAPHFTVFWRAIGGIVQLMDPARGRVWTTREAFARELHVHEQSFEDEESFPRWFSTTEWHSVLQERLRRLAIHDLELAELSAADLGAVDTSARLVERLSRRGAVPRGSRSGLLWSLVNEARRGNVVPPALSGTARDAEGRFRVRGAIFLAVEPRAAPSLPVPGAKVPVPDAMTRILAPDGPTAFDILKRELGPYGRRLVAILGILTAMLAVLALGEMVLLRAAFNAERWLALPTQRFAGVLLYAALVVFILVLEMTTGVGISRVGRALELRMRLALLSKLPRLPDRYFRTRPMTDVTHRSQGLFQVRPLPSMVVQLAKQSIDIFITVIALAALHPRGIPAMLLLLAFGLGAPYLSLLTRRAVAHRVQVHASTLAQLYLDILLGSVPLRTHGGQPAIRARQATSLTEWRRESERALSLLSWVEAVQSLAVLAGVAWLLFGYVGQSDGGSHALLLFSFWALRLPMQAKSLSGTLQSAPLVLASMSRLVEPLTAEETPREPSSGDPPSDAPEPLRTGMSLSLRGVDVLLGTHEVLSDVTVDVASGEHVAIVGGSGAGKSSLLATILGLLDHARGSVLVDGVEIERSGLERRRRETVWVDPSVQLWNRSMLENLHFGNPKSARHPIPTVLDDVDLKDLLEKLPAGLTSDLGESGARVSGGEGQRIRLARALLRRGARLVLLDEAFRGLERPTRRMLSSRVRERARAVTVIEVTHDVADTLDFDRVVVIEGGKVIEDGTPASLLSVPTSRYGALVRADREIQRDVWGAPHWRRLTVGGGKVATHERMDDA